MRQSGHPLQKPKRWVILTVPTILETDGFKVCIYLPPREHEPAHVHVKKGDGEAVILLGDYSTAPSFREVHGMQDRDAVRAYRIGEEHRDRLMRAWEKYHG